MNPYAFLMQDDVHSLVQALNTFALEVDAADARKDTLVNAGIDHSFRSRLIFGASSHLFANQLVAYFREYHVSSQQPKYHPMVSLLDYLLKAHALEDRDREFFKRMVKQGQENFDALIALSAVGRIESPPGTARGTGVLVGRQLLLSCKHVFERIADNGLDSAWVRFGYKAGKYGVEIGELFEVDMRDVSSHPQSDRALDYALVKIIGKPEYPTTLLYNGLLSDSQNIRLIHHPRGEPAQISNVGQVIRANKGYIKHNIRTDYGSSGAPIFDQNWRVVAIHRGLLNSGRSAGPSINEGLPLYSIWDDFIQRLPALIT